MHACVPVSLSSSANAGGAVGVLGLAGGGAGGSVLVGKDAGALLI